MPTIDFPIPPQWLNEPVYFPDDTPVFYPDDIPMPKHTDVNEVCIWTQDTKKYYGRYFTSCDHIFTFNTGFGIHSATWNKFKFCPYCGKPIKDIPYSG